MASSYLIYIGLMLSCFLIALFADKKSSKSAVWVIIILLSIISGLRKETVGIDTYEYFAKFTLISEGAFEYAYGLEKSFKYLCAILLKIYNNNTFLLVVFAFITNGCIILRFWDLRRVSSFSCMVICYYMAFYFMSLNCMRQFCAIAIVFYFTRYLEKKKFLCFFAGIFIACLFHRTAMVALALIALSFTQWRDLSKAQKFFFIAGVMALPLIISFTAQILMRYQKYLSGISPDIGFMLIVKIVFVLTTIFFVFVLQKKEYYFGSGMFLEESVNFVMAQICVCYLLGLILATLGYVFPFADRIGWYFYIFEGVYMGMLIKGRDPLHKLLFGCFIAILLGYGFVYGMTNNSQGTMPYSFFWQHQI